MGKKLPSHYERVAKRYPKLISAVEALGEELGKVGPLDKKTCELVKLGISVGTGLEGAVHSHTRRALQAGAGPDEIRHAVLLALTTAGFPRMMAALSWAYDVL